VREDEGTQAQACYQLGAQAESASVAMAARRPRRPPACCLDNQIAVDPARPMWTAISLPRTPLNLS
jgi:hypothetical protein